jgi:polyhydroxyalkanoate synthase
MRAARIGLSPKRTVWRLNKSRLYYYEPGLKPERRHRVPLLLVYAPVGRPWILDLRPGHSFVQYMVGCGYEVYLLDWGPPGPEDAATSLDDYVLCYLTRAVRKMRRLSGCAEFSLFGWSLSAIITTCYAALAPAGIRNLILVAAPLDLSLEREAPILRWVHAPWFGIDGILSLFGNMPGELISLAVAAMRPGQRLLPPTPEAIAWSTDLVPVAGAAFRQMIVDFYRENRLVRGTLEMGEHRVDLNRITASLLNVVAVDDFVAPPCQSEPVLDLVSSTDKANLRLPGTHVSVMAGADADKLSWPNIEAWLAARSG